MDGASAKNANGQFHAQLHACTLRVPYEVLLSIESVGWLFWSTYETHLPESTLALDRSYSSYFALFGFRLRLAIQPQLQSLLSEIPWGEEVFEATPGKTRGQYWGTVFKRIRNRSWWIWRAYVRWLCCRTLAVLCAVLSAMILWSEVGLPRFERSG